MNNNMQKKKIGKDLKKMMRLTNPTNMKNTINPLPNTVLQKISPYPTVDIVTMRKYTHSQQDKGCEFTKCIGSPEFSNQRNKKQMKQMTRKFNDCEDITIDTRTYLKNIIVQLKYSTYVLQKNSNYKSLSKKKFCV